MYKIENIPAYITLGNQGEKGTNIIQFDISAWQQLYPIGANKISPIPEDTGIWLTYTREGSEQVYPELPDRLSIDENVLIWKPSNIVLTLNGYGTVVIHCTENADEKRTSVFTMDIVASHDPAGPMPDPLIGYIELINENITRLSDISFHIEGKNLFVTIPDKE